MKLAKVLVAAQKEAKNVVLCIMDDGTEVWIPKCMFAAPGDLVIEEFVEVDISKYWLEKRGLTRLIR